MSSPKRLHPIILRYDSLPSTNTEAARQALRGAPEGTCIVAREQTEGRGRQQREWVSPAGAGLYCSIVLRPTHLDLKAWPLITLMAALAVADALLEACALPTDIKWPNDILVRGRKLCGILAETVETFIGRACILGIGINLDDRAFPPDLQKTATSVTAQKRFTPDAEHVLSTLMHHLGRYYHKLQSEHGAERTLREWCARSSYADGRRVRVYLEEESFVGITRGLERDGALRVETDTGEIKTVRAGDVMGLRRDEMKEMRYRTH